MRFKNKVGTFCALAVLALCATSSPSRALTPSMPSTTTASSYSDWTPFTWAGGPGAYQNESPFTFTADGPVILDVTDAFAQGDRFEVHNISSGDQVLGMTSQVNNPANFNPEPDETMGSVGFSHGSFSLPEGTYSIVFKNVQIAEGADSGTAYFRVRTDDLELSQVPEPGTLVLAAFGLGGLALPGLRRWKRRAPQPA